MKNLGFMIAVGVCSMIMEGQSLSFFKTLPGSSGGSPILVDGSGVYSLSDKFRRYDREGALIWSREYRSGETVAWLASSSAGLYAAGHIPPRSPAVLIDAFVRLYNLQGDEVWNRQFGFPNSRTINRAIAADPSGVYVAGDINTNGVTSSFLRKYDAAGTELWAKRFEDPEFGASALTTDSNGVYVFNGRSMRKYSASGTEVWNRKLDGGIQAYDMKANDTGIYLTGFDANKKDYFLARYNANGDELWIRYGQSGWVALDANSVYVTASTPNREPGQCSAGSDDVFVVRYDFDGKILWTRQFGTPGAEYPRTISADSNSLFVAGFGPDGSFLAKLDPAPLAVSTSEPRIRNECIVNAASYVGGAVSPGEIVTIFGMNIGPVQPVTARSDRALGTTLAETRILFDGVPAPLLYTSSEQVGVVVPNSVLSKSLVAIQVEYRGALSKSVTLPVFKAHPGIFSLDASGEGQAAVLNQDGTLNTPANPARSGSMISIFATGGGETNPITPDGQIVANPTPKLKNSAIVKFHHLAPGAEDFPEVKATYAGAVSGFVAGLTQINVRVPDSVASGNWFIQLTILDGPWSVDSPPMVKIAVSGN